LKISIYGPFQQAVNEFKWYLEKIGNYLFLLRIEAKLKLTWARVSEPQEALNFSIKLRLWFDKRAQACETLVGVRIDNC